MGESRYHDKKTRVFANGDRVPQFHPFAAQAYKRLELLENAESLNDIANIRSNRFEKLGGNRQDQFSIRINSQWRICFTWSEERQEAFNIEIVDYHS